MAARDSRLLGAEEYTGYSLIIIAAGLGVGGWELWYFHHGEISAIVMQVSHLQMIFIRRSSYQTYNFFEVP
ncbi:hypothetical protein [Methylocapsa palsarum]|uniref:Uncharacterized protein n=1 Tax=Methylocapsa palsarum TaxID=1612308 RepID=A0A1I4DG70_9HYPH|nr:hypothetical protein [Methylocapsa palsarum]SFK91780.1 hypothetical protein SAMN05444581_1601 [Methylocapsa palsarum]